MFLLVGGPRFVFSGKAYVDSTMSFARNACDLQSSKMKLYCNVVVFTVTGQGYIMKKKALKSIFKKMKNLT